MKRSASAALACLSILGSLALVSCSEDSSSPIRLCLDDQQKPSLIYYAPAAYPDEAIAQQLSGTVLVKVLVGKDGRVLDAAVIASRHVLLDSAALDAAKLTIWEPGRMNCEPVQVWMAIPYKFTAPQQSLKQAVHGQPSNGPLQRTVSRVTALAGQGPRRAARR